jgi:valyl-tRNA synthetase
MAISSKYDPSEIEHKWYSYWMDNGYFYSKPDSRPAYTIVIPPPNVTGILHMGHMLNNTIQDILIRRARLLGFNACWVPGTDHASIATEAKVVAKLKESGIEKKDLSREEFIGHAWNWTHEYGGVILEQLKKLGCSCDWERTKFTMDEDMNAAVIKTFVDLYSEGKIYRGFRMVNWDPEAQTTLSDEEVIYEEKQDLLYYLSYKLEDGSGTVTIATTRPETILGDTAICVNPNDERYKSLVGKYAIVPVCGRRVPIISDDYVDIEFGTGCLKVTPAHDMNDKILGEKHNLEVIDILNPDGTLNQLGLHYEGQDRAVARKAMAKELEQIGVLVKTELITHKVGTSERTKAIIEPRLSDQWFLKMEDLAEPAIEAVLSSDAINFFPKKFENTYRHWMSNIRDWNISRQLWWGQQIPAYYYGEGNNDFVVATSKTEALDMARTISGKVDLRIEDLRQDADVLDTWFSSWLWPMSVFDGINHPENEEFKYYYPTNDLVTGPDILFFWVARMIMAGYKFSEQKPFSNVYFTGLVRDKQRRKMSKSLGNSPDALQLIEDFGADGVRVGLLLSAAAGNDLLFDDALCQQGKGFANKIWNAFRLVKGWEVSDTNQPKENELALEWYTHKFDQAIAEIDDHFDKYRLSDALMTTYKLIWDDFCSWLLEAIKPEYGQPIDRTTYDRIIVLFEQNLKILHPFMPFLTEEIWQQNAIRQNHEALVVADWPKSNGFDPNFIAQFESVKEVVGQLRALRKSQQIPFKEQIQVLVYGNMDFSAELVGVVKKLTNLSEMKTVNQKEDGALSFRIGSTEYFVPVSGPVDTEGELIQLKEELKYTKGFLKAVQGKLSNERFVGNAPESVVAIEKQKEKDALEKIEMLQNRIESLEI